jgi:CHAD domain-containing protein
MLASLATFWHPLSVKVSVSRPPHRVGPRVSLLSPDLTVPAAVRRLIKSQSEVIRANLDGVRGGKDSAPLHDLRVAIRRLRTTLRAFRKPLAGTSAARIDPALQQLNRCLGPARDLDVWLAFLSDAAVEKSLAGHRRWKKFVCQEQAGRKRQQAMVQRCLGRSSFLALQQRLDHFERVELSSLPRASPSETVADFAQRAWGKSLRRALGLAKGRRSERSDELHQLRRALRRARYLGEFFAPVLGEPFDKLTRRIHGAEQALGKIHDADVGLAPMPREGLVPPRLLVRCLKQHRAASLAKLEARWRRLEAFLKKRDIRRKLRL